MPRRSRTKLRVGVSSCLLGHEVRWNGEHRRDALVADVLARFFELVPVCPELELGLGVPREPIRLVGAAGRPRLVGHPSGKDHTSAMRAFAKRRARELEELGIDGFVTKKDSPSCGLERVRVWPARGGAPRRLGSGVFASALVDLMPLLPVEEEDRLEIPALRASFVERTFAHARWRTAVTKRRRSSIRIRRS